ncbi:MAG: 4Fe-4S dicluster domain-containing protein, partial [Ruminiclostridium sp.]
GIHPVIECTQNIPCNPCQDACPRKCIKIGDKITSLPVINTKRNCSGCGMCVASCSGQAIFLVNEEYEPGFAAITMPYEFLPLPVPGDKGKALDRSGKEVCSAEIIDIKSLTAFDHTHLLTIKVPDDMVMKARFFRSMEVEYE